jgi:hypothetical protein
VAFSTNINYNVTLLCTEARCGGRFSRKRKMCNLSIHSQALGIVPRRCLEIELAGIYVPPNAASLATSGSLIWVQDNLAAVDVRQALFCDRTSFLEHWHAPNRKQGVVAACLAGDDLGGGG